MSNIRLPKATLIDIKRISKDCQSKLSARINYSKLFDLKEEYKYPEKQDSFFGTICSYYPCHLTKNMEIINDKIVHLDKIMHLCVKKCTSGFYNRDYEKNDNNNMFSIRPVFKYSDIKDYCDVVEKLAPDYLIVTFGCYPQRKIGYLGDYDSSKIHYSDEGYTLRIDGEEVLYNVVSIEGKEGKYVEKNSCLYLIEPVRFLVDVKKGFAISELCLIEMRPNLKLKIANFENTTFYKFLNTHFVPELMQSITKQNEAEIKSEENPLIKERIDNILSLITDNCIEHIVKEELQRLINDYNNDLESEKEAKEDIGLTLTIPKTSDTKFLEKLDVLYSKIKCFPYYNESKVIFGCLHLEKKLEIERALYKDITIIFNYILPTLPDNKRKKYEEEVNAILNYVLTLIIKLYQTESDEKVNIELEVRKRLQPVLEELSKDVATNYIDINLNEIIKGIFKVSNDKY